MMLPAAIEEAAAELPPTAKPLAAEPPMTAAEPLSLLIQVCFEGLLVVAESDMICRRGAKIEGLICLG